jgi:hypothetical protein
MANPVKSRTEEREPSETNMDGFSLSDARLYFHFCPDRVQREEEVREKKRTPARS